MAVHALHMHCVNYRVIVNIKLTHLLLRAGGLTLPLPLSGKQKESVRGKELERTSSFERPTT